MKNAIARGLIINAKLPLPVLTKIDVRTESTGDFKTLSLSDDNVMIQVVVTPEVKKLLKDICK